MLSISPVQPARTSCLRCVLEADVVGVVNWYHGSLAYSNLRRARPFAILRLSASRCFTPNARGLTRRSLSDMLERCDAVAAMTEHEKRFIEHRSSTAQCARRGRGSRAALFAKADGRHIRTSTA